MSIRPILLNSSGGLVSVPCQKLFSSEWIDSQLYGKTPLQCLLHSYSTSEVVSCYNQTDYVSINSARLALHSLTRVNLSHTPALLSRTLFLNVLCNHLMLPKDATCCMTGDSRDIYTTLLLQVALQFGTGLWLMSLLVQGLAWLFPGGWRLLEEELPGWLPRAARALQTALLLSALLTFIYYADRSKLFSSSPKEPYSWLFLPLLALVLILCMPFWRASSSPSVLSREQSGEMKGWMQLVILLYHYTASSKVLSVYVVVRLMVTAYLLLSGFGHFKFFWKTGDFSPSRVVKVLVRYNLTTVLISMVTGLSYSKYYFVPLISLWYVFGYVFMATWPRITADRLKEHPRPAVLVGLFLLKVLLAFVVVEILVSSQSRFAGVWAAVLGGDAGTLREWWFRVQLDRHAFLWGVLLGLGLSLWDGAGPSGAGAARTCATAVLSLAAVVAYAVAMTTCTDKPTCNAIHMRWSFMPVLGFIGLRNLTPLLQTYYNFPCQFLGLFALELFVCQFHIWLSKDTYGVLLYSPSLPLPVNFVLATLVFLFIAHKTYLTANTLLSYVF